MKKENSIESKITHEINTGQPLIFIQTQEENEIIRILQNISEAYVYGFIGYDVIDCNQNLLEDDSFELMDDESSFESSNRENSMPGASPESLIEKMRTMNIEEKTIYLFRDLSSLLDRSSGRQSDSGLTIRAVRILKKLSVKLKQNKSVLILVDQNYTLPNELQNDFAVLEHQVPEIDLLEKIFYDYIADTKLLEGINKQVVNNILRSAKGLTADQFRRAIASTYVKHQEINSQANDEILRIKKEIIQRSGMLEYIEDSIVEDDVGGLDKLKDWAKKRKRAFTIAAEKENLPTPKGILVWGVPGTGKSLISKAISGIWRRPILRFDIGRIFGSYVGESEKNMRNVLRVAESIAPCILWIDEIEKAFSSADRGSEVSNRVLGTFLTWMQEKAQSEKVFIVATANQVTLLPPELLRKGRFDQLFFVQNPDINTTKEILEIQLKKYKINPKSFNIEQLAKESAAKKLTGSEIEQIIIDSKFNAFDEKRIVSDDDIKGGISALKQPIAANFYGKIRDGSEPEAKAYSRIEGMSIKI